LSLSSKYIRNYTIDKKQQHLFTPIKVCSVLPSNVNDVECVSGIHVIARSGVRLNYIVYNLSTSKIERDSAFPTEAQAFMGSYRSAITLLNPGDVSRQRNGSHLTLVNMFFYN